MIVLVLDRLHQLLLLVFRALREVTFTSCLVRFRLDFASQALIFFLQTFYCIIQLKMKQHYQLSDVARYIVKMTKKLLFILSKT